MESDIFIIYTRRDFQGCEGASAPPPGGSKSSLCVRWKKEETFFILVVCVCFFA